MPTWFFLQLACTNLIFVSIIAHFSDLQTKSLYTCPLSSVSFMCFVKGLCDSTSISPDLQRRSIFLFDHESILLWLGRGGIFRLMNIFFADLFRLQFDGRKIISGIEFLCSEEGKLFYEFYNHFLLICRFLERMCARSLQCCSLTMDKRNLVITGSKTIVW